MNSTVDEKILAKPEQIATATLKKFYNGDYFQNPGLYEYMPYW